MDGQRVWEAGTGNELYALKLFQELPESRQFFGSIGRKIFPVPHHHRPVQPLVGPRKDGGSFRLRKSDRGIATSCQR